MTMRKLILLLIPYVMCGQQMFIIPALVNGRAGVSQADWYIDYVLGNDANNGRTPITPLKTLAELATGSNLVRNTNLTSLWNAASGAVINSATQATFSASAASNVNAAVDVVQISSTITFAVDAMSSSGNHKLRLLLNATSSGDITVNATTWTTLSVTLPLSVATFVGENIQNGTDAQSWAVTIRQPRICYGTSCNYFIPTSGNSVRSGGFIVSSGQVIALRCGQTWNDQIVVPTYSINGTVTSWGACANPLIDSSDPLLAANWTATGGQANVYQQSVTVPSTGGFARMWINSTGAVVPIATSLVNCQATPGTYWISANTAGAQTLYIHPVGNADPTTLGDGYYSWSSRDGSITTQSGWKVYGVHTRRNYGNNGSLVAGAQATLLDVQADDGAKHNLFIGDGSTVDRFSVRESYYNAQSATMLEVFTVTPSALGIILRNGILTNSDPNVVTTAIYAHHDTSANSYGAMVLSNISVNLTGHGSGFGVDYNYPQCTSLTVLNFVSATSPLSVPCSGSVSSSTLTALGNGVTAALSLFANSITVSVSGSTLSAVAGAGYYGIYGATYTGISLSVQTTSIQNAQYGVYLAGSGSTLAYSQQNSISVSGCSTCNYYYRLPGSPTSSDYNTFSQPAQKMLINGVEYTLANYKTTFGQDAHSTP